MLQPLRNQQSELLEVFARETGQDISVFVPSQETAQPVTTETAQPATPTPSAEPTPTPTPTPEVASVEAPHTTTPATPASVEDDEYAIFNTNSLFDETLNETKSQGQSQSQGNNGNGNEGAAQPQSSSQANGQEKVLLDKLNAKLGINATSIADALDAIEKYTPPTPVIAGLDAVTSEAVAKGDITMDEIVSGRAWDLSNVSNEEKARYGLIRDGFTEEEADEAIASMDDFTIRREALRFTKDEVARREAIVAQAKASKEQQRAESARGFEQTKAAIMDTIATVDKSAYELVGVKLSPEKMESVLKFAAQIANDPAKLTNLMFGKHPQDLIRNLAKLASIEDVSKSHYERGKNQADAKRIRDASNPDVGRQGIAPVNVTQNQDPNGQAAMWAKLGVTFG